MTNLFTKLTWKKTLISFLALVLLGTGGYFALRDDAPEPETPKAQVAGVNVKTVQTSTEIKVPVSFTGKIKGRQSTVIRSLVDGTLLSVVPVNSSVSRGDSLVQINNQSISAQYFSALNTLANAQASFNETQGSAITSQTQAQINLDQAEENLTLAEQALSDAKQTAKLNMKKVLDSAEITYDNTYQILDRAMSYLGEVNLNEYRFEDIIHANQEIHLKAINQFENLKINFPNLKNTLDRNQAETELKELSSMLKEIKKLNSLTITLLDFTVTGDYFTNTEKQTAESQVTSFRTQLNQAESDLTNTLNTIENTKTQNQNTIASLEKKLDIAKLQIKNAENALSAQESSSQIQNLSASSQISSARAQLAAAERQYENLQIPAPFSGTVIEHLADPGDQISPGEQILRLGDLDIIEIELIVASALRKGLSRGQTAVVNGQPVGQITRIQPTADPTTGKIGITIQADNSNGEFISGDIAEVQLDLAFDTDSTIAVPLKNVKVSQSSQTVLVVRDSKVVEQPVQLGEIFGSFIEITQGLKPGDQIIIENGSFLQEGDPVKIQNAQ